jgi:predicted protein tyrosine phosphatase
MSRSNIAPMNHTHEPAIIISPFQHIPQVLSQNDVTRVVSILGLSDKLDWPSVGDRGVLRLRFDDIIYTSGSFVAPSADQIRQLIEFGRLWNGIGSLLVHCRAGSSRSPAAGMIVAAAVSGVDTASLVRRVLSAKAYFRPNEAMLKLADTLLVFNPGLVDLARSIPVPTRTDAWGPVRIPLKAPEGS